MKTLCMPARDDMSSLLRVQWPAEELQRRGYAVDITTEPWLIQQTGQTVSNVESPDCDVIVLCRPKHKTIAESIPLFQAAGIAVVVDYDDDLTAVHGQNVAAPAFDPAHNQESNWRWALQACEAADLVTVSTPALLDVYAKHGRGLVIPNRLPAHRLPERPAWDGPPRLGWAGFIGTHPSDLCVMDGAPSRVLGRLKTFHVIGPGDPIIQTQIGGCRLRATGRVSADDWLPTVAASLDVGVAPAERSAFNLGKCLDAATRIATRRGLLPIGEIETGDAVWADGRWVTVEATQHDAPREGLLLRMASGRQLRLTTNHRLWRCDLGANAWTRADALRVGDELAMTADVAAGMPQRAGWPSDGRASRGAHDRQAFLSQPDVPTVLINERWGRFLGLFAGDGSASGTRVAIHCDGQDDDLIRIVSDDFEAMGLWPATQHLTTYGGEPIRRRSVSASSAHLMRFLRGLGVVEDGAARRVIRIPEVIWRSPREIVSAFLSGLFEADGSTSGTSISFSSKYEHFALEVQRLLTAFGIESTVTEKWNTATTGGNKFQNFRLAIRRAGTDIFAKEIGFLSDRKRARLEEITGRPHSNAYKPQAWKDTIARIEPCTVAPVDLQVEGSVFAASGFVSHNSCLKSIEGAAAGVAMIASPTPDNRRAAADGLCVLADSRREWERWMRLFLDNPQARAEQVERATAGLQEHLLERHAEDWMAAWEAAHRTRQASYSPSMKASVR